LGNGRDLHIRVADGSAQRTAVSGDLRKGTRCFAVEPEDPARQVLFKQGLGSRQQTFPALASGKQFKSVEYFRLSD
jgi:hypothetical protein